MIIFNDNSHVYMIVYYLLLFVLNGLHHNYYPLLFVLNGLHHQSSKI